MTDREMLELAAKAAGLVILDRQHPVTLYVQADDTGHPDGVAWNPLADDRHALKLAYSLCIDLEWHPHEEQPYVEAYQRNDYGACMECFTAPISDYRRAIVRAAAAIGKAML